MTIITSINFDKEVLQSKTPVILLWTSTTDVNGSQLQSKLSAHEHQNLKCCIINIDSSPDLAIKYSLRQLPFLMRFENSLIVAYDVTLSEKITGVLDV